MCLQLQPLDFYAVRCCCLLPFVTNAVICLYELLGKLCGWQKPQGSSGWPLEQRQGQGTTRSGFTALQSVTFPDAKTEQNASERDLAQRDRLGFVASSGFHGPHGEAGLQNVIYIVLVIFPFPWTPVHPIHRNGDILSNACEVAPY